MYFHSNAVSCCSLFSCVAWETKLIDIRLMNVLCCTIYSKQNEDVRPHIRQQFRLHDLLPPDWRRRTRVSVEGGINIGKKKKNWPQKEILYGFVFANMTIDINCDTIFLNQSKIKSYMWIFIHTHSTHPWNKLACPGRLFFFFLKTASWTLFCPSDKSECRAVLDEKDLGRCDLPGTAC